MHGNNDLDCKHALTLQRAPPLTPQLGPAGGGGRGGLERGAPRRLPTCFRRAACALLLAGHRLAVGGRAPRLTEAELSHILRLAWQPLMAWVPELHPFLPTIAGH